jgi:hypothetical protein
VLRHCHVPMALPLHASRAEAPVRERCGGEEECPGNCHVPPVFPLLSAQPASAPSAC